MRTFGRLVLGGIILATSGVVLWLFVLVAWAAGVWVVMFLAGQGG